MENMRAREPRLHLILLPLAALIAVTPLIFNGSSCGHDFDFHILNWFEASRQFLHGNLHPHWTYTFAYNAGEPRFVFYPPLSWTIGAILGLIMPHAFGGWLWTPIVYTWLSLAAAGLALYYLARDFATPNAALLAAAIYIVNPYTLFTAYERTAYGELLAAAWIPLLLHAILRDRVTIPRIAIPIALLWLTDAPAAVMSCYAFALVAIIRLFTNSSAPFVAQPHRATGGEQSPLRLFINATAGTLLGLGLAAFYIVPAAWERRYVQIRMAIIDGMRIEDNFLFHHTADRDHDLVLRTASIVALVVLALVAAAFILIYLNNRRVPHPSQSLREGWDPRASSNRRPPDAPFMRFYRMGGVLLSLAILTAAIALMLTPISGPIWRHTPEMAYLQFPWRLTAILAAIMAFAIAMALSSLNLKTRPAIVIALIATAILTPATYVIFRQPCYPEDTVQARLAVFHSNQGTDPTDEYTPITADNDALADSNPPFWLAADATADAPPNSVPGRAPMRLTVTAPAPEVLILNLRDYPAWRITRNGALITGRGARNDGLIAIPVPAGTSHIAIAWAHTPDQILGDIFSILSLLLLLLSLRRAPI